jgi:hypothetical protein
MVMALQSTAKARRGRFSTARAVLATACIVGLAAIVVGASMFIVHYRPEDGLPVIALGIAVIVVCGALLRRR